MLIRRYVFDILDKWGICIHLMASLYNCKQFNLIQLNKNQFAFFSSDEIVVGLYVDKKPTLLQDNYES